MQIDQEIYEVEQRISRRQHDIARGTAEAGRGALHALASPPALLVALAAGFLLGGGLSRRRTVRVVERRRHAAKKKTGIAGLLGAGALALLRARTMGTPLALAQLLISRLRNR